MTDTQHLWTIADICAATNGQTNDQAAATKTDGMTVSYTHLTLPTTTIV